MDTKVFAGFGVPRLIKGSRSLYCAAAVYFFFYADFLLGERHSDVTIGTLRRCGVYGKAAIAMLAAMVGLLCHLGTGGSKAFGAFQAVILLGQDGFDAPVTGTSNPAGIAQVNPSVDSPGYLNQMSGGINGGATGAVGILNPYGNTELVALAIHVTDNAGDSHSLSSGGDPALADIVSDLNISAAYFGEGMTAYAFGGAPQEYSGQVAALSAGETANRGQPFDILLVENFSPFIPHGFLNWNMDFSGEIGNADGITALSITDVGAIPEPAAGSLVILLGAALLFQRARPKHRETLAAASGVNGRTKGDGNHYSDFPDSLVVFASRSDVRADGDCVPIPMPSPSSASIPRCRKVGSAEGVPSSLAPRPAFAEC
jgi:hypothetical protein